MHAEGKRQLLHSTPQCKYSWTNTNFNCVLSTVVHSHKNCGLIAGLTSNNQLVWDSDLCLNIWQMVKWVAYRLLFLFSLNPHTFVEMTQWWQAEKSWGKLETDNFTSSEFTGLISYYWERLSCFLLKEWVSVHFCPLAFLQIDVSGMIKQIKIR